MGRRLSMVVLGAGIGLAGLLPVVGIPVMVGAAVALAISLERDMLSDGAAPSAVTLRDS